MFTDDTKIKTPNGDKLIRHIKVGDMVYRADNSVGEVKEVKLNYQATYAVVCVNNGKHVVYAPLTQSLLTSGGFFEQVGMLRMGVNLKSVGKISVIAESGERKCYGLVVDGDNTYIANEFLAKGE